MRIILAIFFFLIVKVSFAQQLVFPNQLDEGDTLLIKLSKLRCHNVPIESLVKVYRSADSVYQVDSYLKMAGSVTYARSDHYKSNRREARKFLKSHGSSDPFQFVPITPVPIDSLQKIPIGVMFLYRPILYKIDSQFINVNDLERINNFCLDVIKGDTPQNFREEYGVSSLINISIKNGDLVTQYVDEQRFRGWYNIKF